MAKTEKELAFLRDLFVDEEWTRRFSELADKHIDLRDAENLLYINSGTGTHCIEIKQRSEEDLAIFGTCENEHLLRIAADKAVAASADVDFSMISFDADAFDVVVADASFVDPEELKEFFIDTVRVANIGGRVVVMLPSAGTFGEILSMLWEVLYSSDLGEHGAEVERLIANIPSVDRIEQFARDAGLVKVKTNMVNELFEFENGDAFVSSPLIGDFLLPKLLKELDEHEKEQVSAKLAQLIDAEDGDLSFTFSVKVLALTGEKG